MKSKSSALQLIEKNILKHGYHMYLVSGGLLPRFIYTIGLSNRWSAELIFAGGTWFSSAEVSHIISEFVEKTNSIYEVEKAGGWTDSIGSFSLQKIDDSWAKELMLGACHFYGVTNISAYQICPSENYWTIDIPDLSVPRISQSGSPWCWIDQPWPYAIPPGATAITNIDALRGQKITEAVRWESDQWEMFAGSGPDVSPEEAREVPFATLLAADESLSAVAKLAIGEGIWRSSPIGEWQPWRGKPELAESPQ